MFIDTFIVYWNRQVLQVWEKNGLLIAELSVKYNTLAHFLSIVPFTRSDIPGSGFCVWEQMCLCKAVFHCVELNVTMTPQKERTWYALYSDSGNITIQNIRQRFPFFSLFFPRYNLVFNILTVRHLDRFMDTGSVQHSWYFQKSLLTSVVIVIFQIKSSL